MYLLYCAQCPEMILNKIEKNFQQYPHRIKEFSSEIPKHSFLKVLAVRACNLPAKQQCQLGHIQAVLAALPRWWIPRPYS